MAEPIRNPETEDEPRREPNIIGKPFRRVDGRAKVTGATKFADDLAFPRMCFVRLVRSTQPHATIKAIDFSEAAKVPGFLGSLTGQDTPIPFGILPVSQDEHALCPDKVRFVGDPVAAVAAVTEDAAYEAALRVKVEYEPLATISSIEEAIATPEPRPELRAAAALPAIRERSARRRPAPRSAPRKASAVATPEPSATPAASATPDPPAAAPVPVATPVPPAPAADPPPRRAPAPTETFDSSG